jgi:hypothetical protein
MMIRENLQRLFVLPRNTFKSRLRRSWHVQSGRLFYNLGCYNPCTIWDVTTDCLSLTEDLLKSFLKLTENNDSLNIGEHLNKARNACELSRITGFRNKT